MVMVIIAGHIDLSVGSVAAVVGIVVAIAMRDWGIPWCGQDPARPRPLARCGAIQGVFVAHVGIPGFIVTLALGLHVLLRREPVRGRVADRSGTEGLPAPGNGYLPEWGPNTGMNNSTLLLGPLSRSQY